MTDKLTPDQRRRCMQANRSSGTKPELMLAKELWHRGYRYRLNNRKVLGSPDICFRSRKVAVFVDGEFWHGRNWETAKLRIKSNQNYWYPKIERNQAHDAEVNALLAHKGWTVVRFWDSEVRKNLSRCADRVEEVLRHEQIHHLHCVYAFDTQYEEGFMAAEADSEWGLSEVDDS